MCRFKCLCPFQVATLRDTEMRLDRKAFMLLLAMLAPASLHADEAVSKYEQTPYTEQKVVFDFYFDDPAKINTALFWIRSLINPLLDDPYGMAPEFLDIKVIIHGTELVTVARKNYEKYRDAVERMRYYASLGVEFRVCGLAAQEYDYDVGDFYDFVKVVPSAIADLAHWQLEGYALLTPTVMEKKYAIEEIR